MSLHKEISFETEICRHLTEHGWLYAEGDAAAYDRARALFPADVLAWVLATQPQAWETLTKNHGANAGFALGSCACWRWRVALSVRPSPPCLLPCWSSR